MKIFLSAEQFEGFINANQDLVEVMDVTYGDMLERIKKKNHLPQWWWFDFQAPWKTRSARPIPEGSDWADWVEKERKVWAAKF